MKRVTSLLLALSLLVSCWISAQALAGSNGSFPSREEYEAAMVIVRQYHARQRAGRRADPVAIGNETSAASWTPEDEGAGVTAVTRAVTNPPVRVFGNGEIEGSSVSAITADGEDGTLWVGYPDLNNQEASGRLVFSEDLRHYREGSGFCGFQFDHDGDANTLTLEGICSSSFPPVPIVTFHRGSGDPVLFQRSVGIGGSYFDGSSGGGYLPVMFLGNNALTCSDVCGNHSMDCAYAVDLTSFAASTCGSVAGDIQLQLCACEN